MLRIVEKMDNPVNSGKQNAKQDFLCQDEDVTIPGQRTDNQNKIKHCKNDP